MPRAPNQDILLDSSVGVPIDNTQATVLTHPIGSQMTEESVLHPSVLRAKSHPRYNCHGLTFASRRTAIIADAEVQRIISEDGYRPVINPAEVLPGDMVIYFAPDNSIDHSGVVVSKPEHPLYRPWVVSKWGAQGPEVLHRVNDVQFYTIGNVRYYRIAP